MFDLLLESSHRDDSNKRSNIEFGQEIMELASIEVYFTHVNWSSGNLLRNKFTFGLHVHNRCFVIWGLHSEALWSACHWGWCGNQFSGWSSDRYVSSRWL